MSLRFQKFWFRYTCRFGKSSDRRISQQIKHCFKFGSKTIEKCGVERKSHFILHSFLSNISSKYTVNHAFISWSSKVETVKGFLHKCYVQKMKRVEIMEAYWNKIVDLTDWNILMASNSGMGWSSGNGW